MALGKNQCPSSKMLDLTSTHFKNKLFLELAIGISLTGKTITELMICMAKRSILLFC
jgi:hypothetical protein